MSANLLSYPKFRGQDSLGNALSGGKLYSYESGTTTPKATYTTAAATVENANPVVLDTNGEAVVFLDGAYKFVLKNSSDVVQWTMEVPSGWGHAFATNSETVLGSATDKVMNPASIRAVTPLTIPALRNGTIADTVTAISTTECTMVVESAITLTANLTIPSTLTLKIVHGGSIDGAYTLTINGPFEGCPGCFSDTDTDVVFGYGATKEVYPNWWKDNLVPGTTIMTDAINDAIDSVEDTGGCVKLLNQTYAIDGEIRIIKGITFEGTSWASVIKQTAQYRPLVALDLSAEQQGLILRSFVVDGNGYGLINSGLVAVDNFAGFIIDHLWVKNGFIAVDDETATNGISTSQATGTHGSKGVIENCLVEYCGKPGIYAAAGSQETVSDSMVIIRNNIVRYISGATGTKCVGIVVGAWNSIVDGNYVYSCDSRGILVSSGPTYAAAYPFAATIVNNHVFNNGGGVADDADGIVVLNADEKPIGHVLIDGNFCWNNGTDNSIQASGIRVDNLDDVTISNNRCLLNYSNGIRVENSKNPIIIGNRSLNNNQLGGSSGSGISIKDVDGGVIKNNICTDNQDTKTQEYGLSFTAGTVASNNLLISGNNLIGNNTGPIRYYETITNSQVHDNHLLEVALTNGFLARETAAADTSGTDETTLYTVNIPQYSYLYYKGVRITSGGLKLSANGTKTGKIYLGTNDYTFHAAANNTDTWRLEANISFYSSTTQRLNYVGYDGTTVKQDFESPSVAMSTGDVELKLTFQCSHADDTVRGYLWTVELY